jgi:site-specific recombinase XerD
LGESSGGRKAVRLNAGYCQITQSNLKEPSMTPLRQRFIEDMQLRGLAPTTQRSYLHYVAEFAKFYGASPEHLDLEAVRQYQLYLLNERKLSPESINTFVSAVQFLYQKTLEMPWGSACFPRVRCPQRLPVVLSPEEVGHFFRQVPSLKYRAVLMTCYGAGLRISEAVALRVVDIDSRPKTATPCSRHDCLPCCASTGARRVRATFCSPPGARSATSRRAR